MKDILSKKRKLGDYAIVALSQECSAILQKKLPPKLQIQVALQSHVLLGMQYLKEPYVI